MNVISFQAIKEFVRKHKDSNSSLNSWYRIATKAEWKNLAEVKQSYPHADLYGRCTIFNIGGNKYRLIAKIDYRAQVLLIRKILTHAEYDKDKWKADCEA
jgi:mRNA interferase HigB